jgi:transposase
MEFPSKVVELARAGRRPEDLATEFEISNQTVRSWIEQSDLDDGKRTDDLTSAERTELFTLRKKVKQLTIEREILSKAATWFPRERIASVIRDAYEYLSNDGYREDRAAVVALEQIVAQGETTNAEVKPTLRVNLHTGKPDQRIELSTLKTIVGFLNAQGETLIIGCGDNGKPIGLESDLFASED